MKNSYQLQLIGILGRGCRHDAFEQVVVKRLELHHYLVRDALPALPGMKTRDGRLINARPTLDFLLRQVRAHKFGNQVLRVHETHDMANALATQVLLQLSNAIDYSITIAI
jgi:hypothetical protein